MANLLSTPISELTHAQIVDGMPISKIYEEDHGFCEEFPVLDHKDLCPGTMDKIRAFRSQFEINSVEFEPKLLRAYQNTSPDTIAYKLRLLEMVVIACHNIAVSLYQLDDGTHKQAEWEEWRDQYMHTIYGLPTPFYVDLYVDSDRYPNGLADIVGYWAEHHIFGGVVLFDRGRDEEEVSNIKFRLNITFPIQSRDYVAWYGCTLRFCGCEYLVSPKSASILAPPTERQFTDLLDFLLSPSPSPQADTSLYPLPVRITQENKWCWHRYRGKVDHNIYRFRHELPRYPYQYGDCYLIEEEAMKPLDGGVCDEALVVAAMERMRQICTPASRRQPDPKRRGRPPYFFDP
ncbi:hypothetical protein KVR01_003642 [Diaporthe batatas]|uniref:uncharacterized protein n=1 Tax=Diaporthe batatas TaxID=748121 RepID=UPI001D0396E2|nr:uncharacterized protein KVR01_003642 [Diaporthe batatas]KAG8167953.1 hypothetical protein KVR01_003642 [Diaporthe batatas]